MTGAEIKEVALMAFAMGSVFAFFSLIGLWGKPTSLKAAFGLIVPLVIFGAAVTYIYDSRVALAAFLAGGFAPVLILGLIQEKLLKLSRETSDNG